MSSVTALGTRVQRQCRDVTLMLMGTEAITAWWQRAPVTSAPFLISPIISFLIDSSIIQTELAINWNESFRQWDCCRMASRRPVTVYKDGPVSGSLPSRLKDWFANRPISLRPPFYLLSIARWLAYVCGNGVVRCGEHFNLGTSPRQQLQQPVTLTAHRSDDWHLITGLDANANTSASQAEILMNSTAYVTTVDLFFRSVTVFVSYFWSPCMLQLLKMLNIYSAWFRSWCWHWERNHKRNVGTLHQLRCDP